MLLSKTDDIIAGLKLQDPEAIEVVFSAYRGYARSHYMKNYCRQFGNIHLDDVKQQCLIALLERGSQFRGATKPQLDAFTKKMFRNNIDIYMRRYVRNSKRTAISCGSYELSPFENIADSSLACLESETLEAVVLDNLLKTHIIPSLTEKELEMFYALMDDKDLSQLDGYQNMSSMAVRQRKCRLKKKIRALLNTPEAIKAYKS